MVLHLCYTSCEVRGKLRTTSTWSVFFAKEYVCLFSRCTWPLTWHCSTCCVQIINFKPRESFKIILTLKCHINKSYVLSCFLNTNLDCCMTSLAPNRAPCCFPWLYFHFLSPLSALHLPLHHSLPKLMLTGMEPELHCRTLALLIVVFPLLWSYCYLRAVPAQLLSELQSGSCGDKIPSAL